MQVREIMSAQPACCTPESSLWEVARLMRANDCGAIPVVENLVTRRLAGIVTDRDITCRTLAQGRNPLEMAARDCMSSPVASILPEATLEECCKVMERNRVHRLPVADAQGRCLGIVSQSDIAMTASEHETAEVVRRVSHHHGRGHVHAASR